MYDETYNAYLFTQLVTLSAFGYGLSGTGCKIVNKTDSIFEYLFVA